MFGMTVRDADNLAMGLRICRKLRKIKETYSQNFIF
jgi:hypothetical protein